MPTTSFDNSPSEEMHITIRENHHLIYWFKNEVDPMRVFTWIVRSIVGVMVLICLIMISLAPQQVVTHFNGAGLADAFGPRWWLIVLPLLTVILAEFCIRKARQKRRKQGMLQVPTLTGFEGQCIAVLVSFNVMLWVMLQSEIQSLLVGGIMGL